MYYISTRGSAPKLTFEDVLLTGLARDGGLYVPEYWPRFTKDSLYELRNSNYSEIAFKIIKKFTNKHIKEDVLFDIIKNTYEKFTNPSVAPIKQLGTNEWIMELFHGPTLAFKDYALQIVGQLFEYILTKKNKTITIVGATSGDTGSAAIEACKNRKNINIFILHPKNRVSEVQRKQMTTVDAKNVHNIAIDGSFDDCQDLVKSLFNNHKFRDEVNLSAVNSINWARIMCQIPYYFWSAIQLGSPERPVSFSVPSGNFGNVYAGYAAMNMGLDINQFVVASNRNDILTRFFNSGSMKIESVVPSMSPSMDIQVSSNFERLLFDLCERDGEKVSQLINNFRKTGVLEISQKQLSYTRKYFDGFKVDDIDTKNAIKKILKSNNEVIDPHSVIGIISSRNCNRDKMIPMINLATAHPAKFPDAVYKSTGYYPKLPSQLSNLYKMKETSIDMQNNVSTLIDFVRNNIAI